MRLPLLALVAFGIAFLSSADAHAGMCLDDFGEYVDRIEKYPKGDKGELDEAFECLAEYAGCKLGNHNSRWAGRRGERCMTEGRKSKHRKRMARVCGRILDHKNKRRAGQCLLMLARSGVSEAKGHDIFEELTSKLPERAHPKILTALADPRAIPWMLKEYAAEKAREKGKLNRWDLRKSIEMRRHILNAFWHFASPETSPFLKSIADSETDADLRKRASNVLKRINARAEANEAEK
jgi:hypothetical protein